MQTIVKLNVRLLVDHDIDLDVNYLIQEMDYRFTIQEPYVTIRESKVIELLSTEKV
jgi:hypothetical protein